MNTPQTHATKSRNAALLASFLVALAACTQQQPEPIPTDRWLGEWRGPEGTFLRLEGGNGKYAVTVQNLDGPRTFQGAAAGATIEFDRDGVRERLHATNGADTGMKWLAEKSDCLTVHPGEGYCR